jgi:hypothetical protein
VSLTLEFFSSQCPGTKETYYITKETYYIRKETLEGSWRSIITLRGLMSRRMMPIE